MLLLTGRLKWLNVLRITELTPNQSIPTIFLLEQIKTFYKP